jgi:transcriptional regulator with XRE-family HTH domain
MSFGKNLRLKRKELGLSAEELANRVHVSRSYITLLENGRRRPTKTIVTKIAKGLKLKSWLVEEWFIEDELKKLGIKDRKILYKLRLIIEPFLRTKGKF